MIISELNYLESISSEAGSIEGGSRGKDKRKARKPKVGKAKATGTLDAFADGVNKATTEGIVELTAIADKGDAFAATYISGVAKAS